ncbi:MAG: class I SAM-dependent methyltransferase [Patescibacteria group bacterium]
MDNEWWKEAFGSEYGIAFSEFYSVEKTSQEVDFLVETVGLERGCAVLDVPCGQGRHAVALAEACYDVTGLDGSRELLELAKKKMDESAAEATFVQGDMRSFELNRKFGAVITLGNSFGYFEDRDNEEFIKHVATHLKPGGVFVLDLPNTAGMLRSPLGKSEFKFDGGYVQTESYEFDPRSMKLAIRWQIAASEKEKRVEGFLRLYTLPEVSGMLLRFGLEVKKVFGNFFGDEYNIDTPRAIVVARKIT